MLSKIIDSKKYMWDGIEYNSKEDAQKNCADYEKDNFETQLIDENGKYSIYTRRVVMEVKKGDVV